MPVGMLYSQKDVHDLLLDVGMAEKNAKIGAAIALCESPATYQNKPYSDFGAVGDQALADETWGYSYGGFQIRSLRADKGTGRLRDEDQLVRPRFNARSAKAIFKARGDWSAWTTYTTGQYLAFLGEPAEGTHLVLSGESLSTIAASEGGGLTWEDLARWNGIHAPYTIYVGQVILLHDNTGV